VPPDLGAVDVPVARFAPVALAMEAAVAAGVAAAGAGGDGRHLFCRHASSANFRWPWTEMASLR